MLLKAYNVAPEELPADNFTDAGNTYYTDYLAAAKHLGIAAGIGNNKFAPEAGITRQEMFTLLYNTMAAYGELPAKTSDRTLESFADGEDVAAWAREAVTALVWAGIITGSGQQAESCRLNNTRRNGTGAVQSAYHLKIPRKSRRTRCGGFCFMRAELTDKKPAACIVVHYDEISAMSF